ncbi:MAG: hypothetical protein RIQ46_418 [Pseudomonadota bacterium]|jgi:hypothetical protein
MNSDRSRWLILAALPLLGACAHDMASGGVEPASVFGEANRQTTMAQVIDPDPEYATLVPVTSAKHAAQAADRYHRDAVKKPERVSSTATSSSGSNP